jgi:HPt (histidine-containing phosphotransfer) domain-containing protein
VDKAHEDSEHRKMVKHLRINFAKSNKTIYTEIIQALDASDIESAFRLAHTLKANAGQIGEIRLQEAAALVEEMLSGGKNKLTLEQIISFKEELDLVLEKLAPMVSEADAQKKEVSAITEEEKQALLENLENMLENFNPECMALVEDIARIPGTEDLIELIEDLEFEQAVVVLKKLLRR